VPKGNIGRVSEELFAIVLLAQDRKPEIKIDIRIDG